jgi:3-methyladenine DNA glycosylase AlkD
VREGLAAAGDPARAAGQRAYLKSAMPCAGVRMPAVRALVRQLTDTEPLPDRETLESAVRRLWDEAAAREERHAALAVLAQRRYGCWQDAGSLPLYEHLIVTGAWWDLVDDIATHRVATVRRADPVAVDPVLRGWARSSELWLRRTAVLAQIGAKLALDTDLLAEILTPNLHRGEFFLRKAVGWALRDASRHHPGWVATYLEVHEPELSALSKREARRGLAHANPTLGVTEPHTRRHQTPHSAADTPRGVSTG